MIKEYDDYLKSETTIEKNVCVIQMSNQTAIFLLNSLSAVLAVDFCITK